MTPTARSIKLLRDLGYTVERVEHWDGFAHVRRDLLGIIDLLALKPGEILGVQVTDYTSIAKHQRKCEQTDLLQIWLDAGAHFVIHGWGKQCYAHGRWTCMQCAKGKKWVVAHRAVKAPWNGAGALDTDIEGVAHGVSVTNMGEK